MSGVSMRPLSAQLFAAILALPLCASASDNLCNRIPELQHFSIAECECGKGLSKIPVAAPNGMSLIAACGYKKEEFIGIVGDFFFKGNATFNGEIRRVNDPVSGDTVWFNSKAKRKKNIFGVSVLPMKLESDFITVQKFKMPPLSEESPCWAADATIRVTFIYVTTGYNSNEETSYPKEFKVLKVGQYKQCQVQQETTD
jgi:hypothetical protein